MPTKGLATAAFLCTWKYAQFQTPTEACTTLASKIKTGLIILTSLIVLPKLLQTLQDVDYRLCNAYVASPEYLKNIPSI